MGTASRPLMTTATAATEDVTKHVTKNIAETRAATRVASTTLLNTGMTSEDREFRTAYMLPRFGDIAVLTLSGDVAWAGLFDESWKLPPPPPARMRITDVENSPPNL